MRFKVLSHVENSTVSHRSPIPSWQESQFGEIPAKLLQLLCIDCDPNQNQHYKSESGKLLYTLVHNVLSPTFIIKLQTFSCKVLDDLYT